MLLPLIHPRGKSNFCLIWDVRLLQFCMRRILHRIGQCAQNWLSCAQLTKQCRNCKIFKILFSNIALSLAVTAAKASAKHFGAKVIKYFAILCISAAVTGSQFQI